MSTSEIEDQVASYVTAMLKASPVSEGPSTTAYAAKSPSKRPPLRWLVVAAVLAFVGVIGGLSLFAWVGDPEQDSTEPVGPVGPDTARAEELLARAEGLVAAGELDVLCDEVAASPTFCRQVLRTTGADATAPTQAPDVVAPSGIGSDTTATGLVVCGVDGLGDRYVSDFVLVEADGTLKVQNPVYWAGLRSIELEEYGDGTAGSGVTAPANDACPDGVQ